MSSRLDNHIYTDPNARVRAMVYEHDSLIEALANYLGIEFYENLETGEIKAVTAVKKNNILQESDNES